MKRGNNFRKRKTFLDAMSQRLKKGQQPERKIRTWRGPRGEIEATSPSNLQRKQTVTKRKGMRAFHTKWHGRRRDTKQELAGFRKGKSCIDHIFIHIFVLRQILEQSSVWTEQLYLSTLRKPFEIPMEEVSAQKLTKLACRSILKRNKSSTSHNRHLWQENKLDNVYHDLLHQHR